MFLNCLQKRTIVSFLALMEAASFSFFFKKEKIQRTAGTLPTEKA